MSDPGPGLGSAAGAPAVRSGPRLPPWAAVAAMAIAVATVLMVVRLVVAADGDISRFIVVGSTFGERSEMPANVHVADHHGYDGQFIWRLAADPTNLHLEHHLGVAIDNPLRVQRIGYPALAWAVSGGGNLTLLPWVLVAINIACVGALAAMGARLALDAERSRWLGLTLATVPGFAFTVSRDLTELLSATLLVGGLLASRRGAWWVTTACWSYGVLTREQMLLPIAAFGLWRAWEIVRRRSRPGALDAAWLLPGIAFLAWQAVVFGVADFVPARHGTGPHFGPPLVGLLGSIGFWVSELAGGALVAFINALTIVELGVLIALVGAALTTKVPADRAWERWMVAVLAALGLCLTRQAWDVPADLRALTDLSVLAWVLLLRSGTPKLVAPLWSVQLVALAGAIGVRIHSV